MPAPFGCRRLLLLLPALVVLVVAIADGSLATIDNATGTVRENSLSNPEAEIRANPSNVIEIDQSSVATTTTATTTAGSDDSTTTVAAITTTAVSSTTTATSTTATAVTTTTTSEKTTSTPVPTMELNHDDVMPSSCAEFNASTIQLAYNEKARILKCCPPGQMIQPRSGTFQYECVPGRQELKIETVEAHFYGNNECIEVSGEPIALLVEQQDLCGETTNALMYSADQGDEMYVLQNGSLLVLEYGSLVSVFDSYCVEMTSDAQLLAKVCDVPKPHWPASTILGGMIASITALLFTALCYSFVPRLNNTFGYLIAGHAGTFAIGLVFLGLARCGDRCIAQGSIVVTEMFANALLGSSVFIFFLMNVLNTMYVGYYIPNGLEYDNRNKREMYAILAVLYTITLIPLFLMPGGALIFIVFFYFGAILITHALSHHYTTRLTSGVYLHISSDTTTLGGVGQTKIDHARLKDICKQKYLCLIETGFCLVCWIAFTILTLAYGHSVAAQVAAVYSVALQGVFIGLVFVVGRQRWTIIRECWSNSGSVDLRAVENGIEMKPLQRPAKGGPGTKLEDAETNHD